MSSVPMEGLTADELVDFFTVGCYVRYGGLGSEVGRVVNKPVLEDGTVKLELELTHSRGTVKKPARDCCKASKVDIAWFEKHVNMLPPSYSLEQHNIEQQRAVATGVTDGSKLIVHKSAAVGSSVYVPVVYQYWWYDSDASLEVWYDEGTGPRSDNTFREHYLLLTWRIKP